MKKNVQLSWKLKKNARGLKKRLFPDLEEATEIILRQRGIDTPAKKEEFLHPDYYRHLADPFLLSDMDLAVQRLTQARSQKEKICIYGDYDVDGITSAVILSDFLEEVGLEVMVYLPDRNKEGYGLNKAALDYIQKQGAQLVITVDCGITNHQEVRYARELGLEVIVTDHHFVPEKIPAGIVINPKKKGDEYPEKMLAGVGVTFKLIQALARQWPDYDEERIKWFLDLVAIGTIADCVPLLGENRTLTKFGFLVLSKTRRVGLKQLFAVGSIKLDSFHLPSGEKVGFQIAPRINAAGRMDKASAAYQLLKQPESARRQARLLALEIESQNKHRQKETQAILTEIEKNLDEQTLPAAILESSPHWSLGLIGLVAGRLTDRYHRPSIILQDRGKVLKGSCRSVPQFHLMSALNKLSSLLEKYGGHAQAAGITIKKEKWPEFKKKFTKLVMEAKLPQEAAALEVDVVLNPVDLNAKLQQELNLLEPFGAGNPLPLFLLENVLVQQIRTVGKDQKHLQLLVGAGEKFFKVIYFNYQNGEQGTIVAGDKVDILCYLEENYWQGKSSLEGRAVKIVKCFNNQDCYDCM